MLENQDFEQKIWNFFFEKLTLWNRELTRNGSYWIVKSKLKLKLLFIKNNKMLKYIDYFKCKNWQEWYVDIKFWSSY